MMAWNRTNRLIVVWIFSALVCSRIPDVPKYFGFLPRLNAFAIIVTVFGAALFYIGNAIKADIEAYQPIDAISAKRLNEQIKLTATSINIIAAAVASAFSITEWATKDHPDYTKMMLFVGVAIHIHLHARAVLGLLKDETIG